MASLSKTLTLVGLLALLQGAAQAAGDPERGRTAFLNTCAACHSVEPGVHRTGPSLAGVWGRKAGTAEGFRRYSEALRKADVVWNKDALEAWLRDPQAFIPGNRMTFPGLPDGRERRDIIAYLESVGSGGTAAEPTQGRGMMGQRAMPALKDLPPEQRVTGLRYCGDTYTVTTAAGEEIDFWEFNLRFKTDSSANGPAKGEPALLPAGMVGDRASIVFSAPEEISAFIARGC